VDDGLREYIEKNSFKNDVIETDFELLMGTITGLEEKNRKLEKQLSESIPKSEIKKVEQGESIYYKKQYYVKCKFLRELLK